MVVLYNFFGFCGINVGLDYAGRHHDESPAPDGRHPDQQQGVDPGLQRRRLPHQGADFNSRKLPCWPQGCGADAKIEHVYRAFVVRLSQAKWSVLSMTNSRPQEIMRCRLAPSTGTITCSEHRKPTASYQNGFDPKTWAYYAAHHRTPPATARRQDGGSRSRLDLLRWYGDGGVALLVLTTVMKRRLGSLLAEPYEKGVAGRYEKIARTLTGAGAALMALAGRKSRAASVAGGALVLAGAATERWAVFKASFESARPQVHGHTPARAPGSARPVAR